MFQSRTHNCGELRIEDAGKKVTLVGWMENVREVGQNFAFRGPARFLRHHSDGRRYRGHDEAVKAINKESTISVTGTVRERDSKNPKLPTGDIEVVPEQYRGAGQVPL
jgi:aspartyl-tRNA synthetase